MQPTMRQVAPAMSPYRAGPPPTPTPSAFNKFFVMEDGVISLSLRWMTIIGSGLVVFLIAGSALATWYLGMLTYDSTHWPFISDISGLPLFDRMYCLVFMFYALSVQ